MSEASTQQPTVIQLFRRWRGGDEAAGQEMAQKFSDWYYAISTIRVPGQDGRPPMEAACQSFAQGIVTVTRPRALVDWAHDLLESELKSAGYGLDTNRPTGSDNPNAMTRNRSPVELIQNVAETVDPGLRRVLALAYDPTVPLPQVDAAADALGGTPFAMLQARYALKRALQSTQDIPFAVVPESADMDRAPISLYEAHRLASGQEICDLEKWLLSDIDLCKDIAEFSAFVHALRGGALQAWAEPVAEPVPEPPPQAQVEPDVAPSSAPDTAPAAQPVPEPTVAPDVQPEPKPKPAATPPDTEPAATSPNPGPESKTSEAEPVKEPEPSTTVPAVSTDEKPAKGSSFKAFLITSATLVLAVILILMIIILVLREA